MKSLFTLLAMTLLIASPVFAADGDTHPQLCSNIRWQVSENCSEEPNYQHPETGELVKRTSEQCYAEDFPTTVEQLAEKVTEEFGIELSDDEGNELECASED